MIQNIFSVYDSKAEAYLPPFFLHTTGMAQRIFSDCANDPEHPWGKNPADYTLFKLGSFNDATAHITLEKSPHAICNGMEVRVENREQDQTVIDFQEKIRREQ